ncbi:MAG: permease-like cell division protein FtsX [Clostridiales bacterium]|nr:permease-like cell division protein FtsX [Clostridiales bacterium]HBM79557.1 ABC transporter permease [Clostridiaceae bacterium]
MKIRTFGYYIKQGFKSVARNRMMSIASISAVMASLIILGIFFITVANVDYLMRSVESGVEIKIFLKDDITNDQMSTIDSNLKKAEGVTDVVYESKQEALDNFKKELGENSGLVEGIDANKVMPSSYIVKMKGPEFVEGAVKSVKGLPGVDKINDARPFVNQLIKVTNFVKTVGITLMVILLIISIFLISNTIKLTVMARRKEIGIMKFIGSTDWFIRWPFIIEGLLLGFIGALLSIVILGYGYTAVVNQLYKNYEMIKLVNPMDIIPYMAALFAAIGLFIGSIGGIISMRKFLRV